MSELGDAIERFEKVVERSSFSREVQKDLETILYWARMQDHYFGGGIVTFSAPQVTELVEAAEKALIKDKEPKTSRGRIPVD